MTRSRAYALAAVGALIVGGLMTWLAAGCFVSGGGGFVSVPLGATECMPFGCEADLRRFTGCVAIEGVEHFQLVTGTAPADFFSGTFDLDGWTCRLTRSGE